MSLSSGLSADCCIPKIDSDRLCKYESTRNRVKLVSESPDMKLCHTIPPQVRRDTSGEHLAKSQDGQGQLVSY